MNRILLVVFKAFFLFSLSGLACGQSNPLATPTTPQAFHMAGDEPTASASSSTSDPQAAPNDAESSTQQTALSDTAPSTAVSPEEEAAQMAHIQAIESRAKHSQNPLSPPAVMASTSVDMQALQAQIVRLGQMSTSSQQQLSDRLVALSTQNHLLELKVISLAKAMQHMQVVMTQMDSQSDDVSTTAAGTPQAGNTEAWKPWLIVLSFIVALLLLMNIGSVWLMRRQAPQSADLSELEEEYDFMGTEEAMPAKLDLARAYVQMGDELQAREVLQEILVSKNSDYVVQAEALLQSLSSSEEKNND